MNHSELTRNLKDLHLHAMSKDYADKARMAEKNSITYEQYLASLVAMELEHKRRIKIDRIIKQSGLPMQKSLEEYDFSCREGISANQVKRLFLGEFVRSGGNVVFYGGVGVGKSHLAITLTQKLCEQGFKCLFVTTCSLINSLIESQQKLMLGAYFKKLDRFDVLICDELGYIPQNKEGADLFFQLISARYERKSMVFTTNLTYSEWDKVFLNSVTTAAAVDRVIHNCETFNIKGESWRTLQAAKRLGALARN